MRERRILLHEKLVNICPNVYFQPPSSIKIKYPAIIYSYTDTESIHADNRNYLNFPNVTLTLIENYPEPDLVFKVLDNISGTKHTQSYVLNGLNYSIVELYLK